jgi:hypothetical protein
VLGVHADRWQTQSKPLRIPREIGTTIAATEVMIMAKKRKRLTRARRRPYEYDNEYGLRRKSPAKAKPKRPAKKR